jgi:hypothetical protein
MASVPSTVQAPIQGGSPAKVSSRKKAQATTAAVAQKQFCATIFPDTPLPDQFVAAVKEVERVLKGPVWLIVQDAPPARGRPTPPFQGIDDHLLRGFLDSRFSIPTKPINVVIESPGGSAKIAYQLANLFRLHCGGFNVYVAEWAKSAATLFVLGASNIYLSKYAEIGPLDVQVFDAEREDYCSALDEVQALERLNAFALQAVDAGMLLLASRSGKSVRTLLPLVHSFVSDMLRPLFEKLDTVHYTQMSRLLKVGEEYAVRLLERKYGHPGADEIARQLVNGYPEHGFYIDRREAKRIGIETLDGDNDLEKALDEFKHAMHHLNVIGQLKEIKP